MKVKIEEVMEKAGKGYKQPFRYDMSGGIIWSADDTWSLSAEIKGLVVRGWGALTGTGGGKGLSEQEAAEIQDSFALSTAHWLNNGPKLLEGLKDARMKLKLAEGLLEHAYGKSSIHVTEGIDKATVVIEAASSVEI